MVRCSLAVVGVPTMSPVDNNEFKEGTNFFAAAWLNVINEGNRGCGRNEAHRGRENTSPQQGSFMTVLYSGNIYIQYNQVALIDEEDTDSYPQWETGTESAVSGEKGIAVATAPTLDTIEVVVLTGESRPDGMRLCHSTEIEVGRHGLIIGNIVTDDIEHLDWPKGRSKVDVYTNGNRQEEVTQVVFVIEYLPEVG